MATTYFSGVNGRIKSAPIAVVAGVDIVVALGTETQTNMVEEVSWKVRSSTENSKVIAAGSPTDPQGNIYPIFLRGAIVNPIIDFEGVYNGDSVAGASSDARFTIGGYVVMTLLWHAVGLWGYYGVVAKVESIDKGHKIAGEPGTITGSLLVNGVFPLPSAS